MPPGYGVYEISPSSSQKLSRHGRANEVDLRGRARVLCTYISHSHQVRSCVLAIDTRGEGEVVQRRCDLHGLHLTQHKADWAGAKARPEKPESASVPHSCSEDIVWRSHREDVLPIPETIHGQNLFPSYRRGISMRSTALPIMGQAAMTNPALLCRATSSHHGTFDF